jgi:hypothetical protein
LPAGLRVPVDEVAQSAEVDGRPIGTPNKRTQLVAETLLGFDVEDVLDPAAGGTCARVGGQRATQHERVLHEVRTELDFPSTQSGRLANDWTADSR